MDNGLIFPYPCVRARDESDVLTAQTVDDRLSFRQVALICCVGSLLVVVKRWGDAGR